MGVLIGSEGLRGDTGRLPGTVCCGLRIGGDRTGTAKLARVGGKRALGCWGQPEIRQRQIGEP